MVKSIVTICATDTLFRCMTRRFPSIVLIGLGLAGSVVPAHAATANAASPGIPQRIVARKFGGASAMVGITARIIHTSAEVGAGRRPPARFMVPRRTTVSAADGRPVAAFVYDFE
jgi:hypothetical protein